MRSNTARQLGKPLPTKTDEFSEKFRTGGGAFPIQKFLLQILDFWTGFFGIKMIQRGIFRVCFFNNLKRNLKKKFSWNTFLQLQSIHLWMFSTQLWWYFCWFLNKQGWVCLSVCLYAYSQGWEGVKKNAGKIWSFTISSCPPSPPPTTNASLLWTWTEFWPFVPYWWAGGLLILK